MSWLSKAASPVLQALSPLTAGFGGLLGYGSKPGVANPFGVPDLSFLKDNSAYDYLKNPVDLTSGFKKIDTSGTDATFNDLLTNIGGQNQNDTEALNNLLRDINIQGENTVGSTKSDFLDRGLGGPGQISDIEANAIAQNRADTGRTAANARTATVGQGLDRLATAYGQKYLTGADTAKTNAATFNDLLKSGADLTQQGKLAYGNIASGKEGTLAKLMADLYSGGAKNNIETQQPGYLDNILRNIKLDPASFMKKGA